MELEGLTNSLDFLEDNGVIPSTFTSDRHSSVKKYFKDNKPNITHLFDVWHVAKGELNLQTPIIIITISGTQLELLGSTNTVASMAYSQVKNE